MPRFFCENQLPDGLELGLWRMLESSSDLLEAIKNCLSDDEMALYQTFRSDRRRREWLATRILIRDMLGSYAPLRYDGNGKPCLPDGRRGISISHAEGMVAVLISEPGIDAAVDIELPTPRISRIQDKFLHPEEIARIPEADFLRCLYIHWCAKEAMYKAFNIRNYDYQNSYAIDFLDGVAACYSGRVSQGGVRRAFYIHNLDIPEYVACVAVLL